MTMRIQDSLQVVDAEAKQDVTIEGSQNTLCQLCFVYE